MCAFGGLGLSCEAPAAPEFKLQNRSFASMIIRVPQENVIPLLKNSGKD